MNKNNKYYHAQEVTESKVHSILFSNSTYVNFNFHKQLPVIRTVPN